MIVGFACGHTAAVSHSVTEPPICGCGETRIARVTAPAPSIRGVCSGPLVQTQNLEPIAVNLCAEGSQPLKLKPHEPEKTDGR